jgi:hypothetical protein
VLALLQHRHHQLWRSLLVLLAISWPVLLLLLLL